MSATSPDAIKVLDKTLRFLRDIYGTDKALRFASYGTKLMASVLEGTGTKPTSSQIQLLRGFGGSVGMARYSVRLWGTMETVLALANHIQAFPEAGGDIVQWRIELAQHLSMLVYYPLDNWMYVHYSSPGVLPAKLSGNLERLSCLAWVVWLALELVSIRRKYRLAKEAGELTTELKDELWYRSLAMGGDAMMGAHYTVPSGIGLTEPVISCFGLLGAAVGIWGKWKAMA